MPLVEEGWTDHDATRLIAREYLEPIMRAQVDTLVLGCTHYPLLKPLLHDVLGPGVRLIDSARGDGRRDGACAGASANSPRAADAVPSYQFVRSDDPSRFLALGQRFLGGAIDDVEIHPLG